jgi:FAD/FMN-containing dehydrogenase
MNYVNIQHELANILDGDVSIRETDLQEKSTDWSLFKITPDLVIYPKHPLDIQKTIDYINNHNQTEKGRLTITARAAGSGMSGGSLNRSIIVDVTRYMNNFRTLDMGDFGSQEHREGFPYFITATATAEPGMFYRDFEKYTLAKKVLMPVFPASRELCAIGGMVANNGAGEKSLKYGQNKDFVRELQVILADGEMYHIAPLSYSELQDLMSEDHFLAYVCTEIYDLIKNNWDTIQNRRPITSKNASGYLIWDVIDAESIKDFEQGKGFFDLTKLFVGAQGTTGIITEITYGLITQETESKLMVIFAKNLKDLPTIVSTLQSYDIETIELYDDHTFKIGLKFFRDFIRNKGVFRAIGYALRFIPEFWMAITGGIPKYIVLAENTDLSMQQLDKEGKEQLKAIKKHLPHCKSFIVQGKKSAKKYWDFRHDSFKLLTEHSQKARALGSGTRTAPFIDDIAVPPENLPQYIPELMNILDEYKEDFLYTIAGHLGDGNFHIIPLVDMNIEKNRKNVLEISQRVYKLALGYGGTITAEHNDGIIRTPFIPNMFGNEMASLFKQIKNIFDPENIFNPGKKVGMTKQDIEKYLA